MICYRVCDVNNYNKSHTTNYGLTVIRTNIVSFLNTLIKLLKFLQVSLRRENRLYKNCI